MKKSVLLVFCLLLGIVSAIHAQTLTTYEDDLIRLDYPSDWIVEIESEPDFIAIAFANSDRALDALYSDFGTGVIEDGVGGFIFYIDAWGVEELGGNPQDTLETSTTTIFQGIFSDNPLFQNVGDVHLVNYANDYTMAYLELNFEGSEGYGVVTVAGSGYLLSIVATAPGNFSTFKMDFVQLMQSVTIK